MSTCNPLSRTNFAAHLCKPRLLPITQTRHESTTRRHKKLLIVPSAPSFVPTKSLPTLVYNPPSSAPNVYHTPLKFLPKDDRRKLLYTSFLTQSTASALRTGTPSLAQPGTPLHTTAPSPYVNPAFPQPQQRTPTASSPTSKSTLAHLPPRPSSDTPTTLPRPVRAPYEKTYHLNDNDIVEIRRLRAEDPDKWTRVRLAEKFGCSQFFVGMVAKHEGKAKRVASEHEAERMKWGKRRREAREDRARRKVLWGRDA